MTQSSVLIYAGRDSCTGSDRVISWLDDHPAKTDGYLQPFVIVEGDENSPNHDRSAEQSRTKRKARNSDQEVGYVRPRLVEVHHNRMSTQPRTPKRPRFSLDSLQAGHPLRGTGEIPAGALPGGLDPEDEENEATQITPRPTIQSTVTTQRRTVLHTIPQLPPRQATDSADSPRTQSSSSIITGSSERASSPPKRTGSPIKGAFDLRLEDISVESAHISRLPGDLPVPARQLCMDLRKIERGRNGFIPECYKGRAIDELRDHDPPDEEDFGDPFGLFQAESAEPAAFWHRICEVFEDARYCQEMNMPEVIWNEKVHSRLLELAVVKKKKEQKQDLASVSYINVTTARIRDISLLPAIAASKRIMDAKLVDFALILIGDTCQSNAAAKCILTNVDSINHTASAYLRYTPIAISIETKRGHVGEDDANLQLALTVHAHFAKLKQLVAPARHPQIPALPLIKVLGHDWFLQVALPPTAEDRIVVYNDQLMGSTNSVPGVFKVIGAVRRLRRWIEDIYDIFIMDNVFT